MTNTFYGLLMLMWFVGVVGMALAYLSGVKDGQRSVRRALREERKRQ